MALGDLLGGMGRYSAAFKVLFIAVLMLLFLIPLAMIRSVIRERESTRDSTEDEIVALWGGEQVIAGPIMGVPYRVHERDERGRPLSRTEMAYFLPQVLTMEGAAAPETRSRGIYQVTVYTADLLVTGQFARPDFSIWRVAETDVLWDQAFVTMEFPDMRALRERAVLQWGDQARAFEPGTGSVGVYDGSMSASVPGLRTAGAGAALEFAMDLRLRGGRSLSFVPLGEETRVSLTSPWPSPSFDGSFLPTERRLDAQGFSAQWYVVSLARNYPQRWRAGEVHAPAVASSAFGVGLMIPVDTYHKAERSVKYGLLFILLPFLTFFLFEVFLSLRIHTMQYLLVGFANCVFYLLLLSIAEHVGFVPAYAIGASATILLIVYYSAAVLSTWRRAAIMTPILVISYIFLYVVLQSEDYALLLGSIGLFVILGGVMVLTRRIDWYGVRRADGE